MNKELPQSHFETNKAPRARAKDLRKNTRNLYGWRMARKVHLGAILRIVPADNKDPYADGSRSDWEVTCVVAVWWYRIETVDR